VLESLAEAQGPTDEDELADDERFDHSAP